MALSQDDRIQLSKKIVSVPKENQLALDTKAQVEVNKAKAQLQDDANKNLFDAKNALINSYQSEFVRLDSVFRYSIVEQELINTAKQKLNNYFSQNNPNVSTPSLPEGVWKNFIPFSQNKAIGKEYNETYGSASPKENDLIDIVNAAVSTMEAFVDIQKSTGQKCGATGSCSLPAYTDELSCTTNAGVWTPGPDLIQTDPLVHSAAADLISAVNNWKVFMQGTLAILTSFTDPNTTRQANNDLMISNINTVIAGIDLWLTYSDFDTTHGQTTCVGFYAYNVSLLDPTKFRSDILPILKNKITYRTDFLPIRVGHLNSALGTVAQNMDSGEITFSSGLYGERFNIINLRLNLMGGTLRKIEALKLVQKSQDEAINSNNNALSVYSSVLKASAFLAPATGISTIQAKDPVGFNIGDSVYIVSDTQSEISTTIVSISGNAITLNQNIPQKYRQNENARIYKEI